MGKVINMGFDKVLSGIGKTEVNLLGEKVLLKVNLGEIPEYQSEIAEVQNKYTDSSGEISNITLYLIELNNIMKKYSIKFIRNANPQYKEEELQLLFETKSELVYDVLDSAGVIDKKKLMERNSKIEAEEIKN